MTSLMQYGETLAFAGQVIGRRGLERQSVVECGVWRGGVAFGLVEFFRTAGRFYFFDSFEGLPKADLAEDGARGGAPIERKPDRQE